MVNRFLLISACLSLLPLLCLGQPERNALLDNAVIKTVNGIDIEDCQMVNQLVRTMLSDEKNRQLDELNNPNTFFTNRKKDKYLKFSSGPDIGYCYYITIGYNSNITQEKHREYLGVQDVEDYVLNNGVRLGLTIEQVWNKASLQFFRNYTYNNTKCYYLEKGIKNEIPFVPEKVFYYKFRDDKLVEIGAGNGMIGVNPMLEAGKQ